MTSTNPTNPNPTNKCTWIYHERQEALLCGQHALNNLLQNPMSFTPDKLAEIAQQLDMMELNVMSAGNANGIHSKDFLRRVAEGSVHVDESGNFSIEVLRSALLTSPYQLTLANTLQESVRTMEITNFDGFICNRSSHWFAIRKIHGRFWNLNSLKDMPEQISHFRLAAEVDALRTEGYSVFCVVEIGALPPPCEHGGTGTGISGRREFWWKESDLLQGTVGKGQGGYTNAWENVGSGMRLDGRPTNMNTNNTNAHVNANGNMSMDANIEGLTEEEMLQMAMAASMMPEDAVINATTTTTASSSSLHDVQIKPEPAAGSENSVRIQFKLPNGKKMMRRFDKTESVKVLTLFVREECKCGNDSGSNQLLQLKAGFPPKDIATLYNETIESAGLSGEFIQCRFV